VETIVLTPTFKLLICLRKELMPSDSNDSMLSFSPKGCGIMAQPNDILQTTGLSNFDWTGLGKELGLAAVLGFAVGYAAKKAMKLVLLVAALLLLLAVALETKGLVTIHWGALETSYNKAVDPDALSSTFQHLVQTVGNALPSTSGFALGCAIGFRRG
jgi:uncharacterized membrane protein (Fun14 family)